jgi:hypothetical protein
MVVEKEPVIEFISKIPGLASLEEVLPRPAHEFKPAWWRTAPYVQNEEDKVRVDSGNVRQCPAFPDLFNSGYILPMWADTTLYIDAETRQWRWRCGSKSSPFVINAFNPSQFTDHVNYSFKGSEIAKVVFQFINPWYMMLPPGYGMFQLPLFYHFTGDYSVLPGTYEAHNAQTDKLEVAVYSSAKEIFIKKGTPLVQYVPYKKTSIGMEVRDATEEDNKIDTIKMLRAGSNFRSWYGKSINKNTEL